MNPHAHRVVVEAKPPTRLVVSGGPKVTPHLAMAQRRSTAPRLFACCSVIAAALIGGAVAVVLSGLWP